MHGVIHGIKNNNNQNNNNQKLKKTIKKKSITITQRKHIKFLQINYDLYGLFGKCNVEQIQQRIQTKSRMIRRKIIAITVFNHTSYKFFPFKRSTYLSACEFRLFWSVKESPACVARGGSFLLYCFTSSIRFCSNFTL